MNEFHVSIQVYDQIRKVGENILLFAGFVLSSAVGVKGVSPPQPGPWRRTVPPSYQTAGGRGLRALICFLRSLPVPLVQRLQRGADETFGRIIFNRWHISGADLGSICGALSQRGALQVFCLAAGGGGGHGSVH